jgi:hypothetical protein
LVIFDQLRVSFGERRFESVDFAILAGTVGPDDTLKLDSFKEICTKLNEGQKEEIAPIAT